jgi:hypothetical protein
VIGGFTVIRKVLAITAALICLGTSASLAQAVVPSSVYTVPQRLIPIDGARRLNLYCTGSGQPTVMLEAGSGNGMMTCAGGGRQLYPSLRL